MGKAIRHVNTETDKVVRLPEMLANDKGYLKKMNLVRADSEDIPPEFKPKKKADPINTIEANIREDVRSMDVDALQAKYNIDDWVVLAKELKLKGNHSKTGEVKLINKIKTKLSA